MAKEPFTSFKPEDFEIEATQKNDKDRTELFRKILVALKPKLNNRFQNALTYTNRAGKQGTKKGKKKEYRDHTWFSLFFGDPNDEEARDTLQFQVSLNVLGTSAFINCDGSSGAYREDLFALFKEHKEECFKVLKNLDDDWFVSISAGKNKTQKFKATGLSKDEWNISKMQLQDMDLIIKYMSFRGADLSIGKSFSKEETLEMKTGILNEFSDTFEKLLPVYDYLTEQSRTKSETLSGKYLLLRSNFSSNNRYDDTPGKYNYPVDIPNSTPDQMCPGTKAIWFTTSGVPDINFIGYGTISAIEDVDVDQVSMKEFNKSFKELDEEEKKEVEKLRDAIFKDYKEFENEKEGTSEIFDRIKQTKIDGQSTWNIRQSIIRTTKEIYEEITNDRDNNLDKKFEEWLERSAKKAGKTIEEYVKDLGKTEYESRNSSFPNLKTALEAEPVNLSNLSEVSKVTTCIGAGSKYFADHYTYELLATFLENGRAENAVRALTEYKDETSMQEFLDIVKEVFPSYPESREPAGDSEKRVGLEPSQAFLIASVFLTALYPDRFVDFRLSRWNTLAKLICIEDEFAPVKGLPKNDPKTLEEVGKFAKKITETSTFKKYWPNQKHSLWTLAGICWKVKDDKPECGDTDMDELVEEILNMDFKLAVLEDDVKKIIRWLRLGKNVVLVGAPGVGKTRLAERIMKVADKIIPEQPPEGYDVRVAHKEWTRRHVVGGLKVDLKGFEVGCVPAAAGKNRWLLIDEFNRADINQAFGEMFFGIERLHITLSDEESKAYGKPEINIPENFRMVCTMNDFDKNLLLTELSYGLLSRFAFIDIRLDDKTEKASVKDQLVPRHVTKEEYEKSALQKIINKFYEFIRVVRLDRMIGVRTCIDVIGYVASASANGQQNLDDMLDEALCDCLLPQFDRLDKPVISATLTAAKEHVSDAEHFIEGLDKMKKQLDEATAWMATGNENSESDGAKNPKEKHIKNPKNVAAAHKSWGTSTKLQDKMRPKTRKKYNLPEKDTKKRKKK